MVRTHYSAEKTANRFRTKTLFAHLYHCIIMCVEASTFTNHFAKIHRSWLTLEKNIDLIFILTVLIHKAPWEYSLVKKKRSNRKFNWYASFAVEINLHQFCIKFYGQQPPPPRNSLLINCSDAGFKISYIKNNTF